MIYLIIALIIISTMFVIQNIQLRKANEEVWKYREKIFKATLELNKMKRLFRKEW